MKPIPSLYFWIGTRDALRAVAVLGHQLGLKYMSTTADISSTVNETTEGYSMTTRDIAKDSWKAYRQGLENLSDRDRVEVEAESKAAAAYVWGWQDGRGYSPDSYIAADFAWTYGLHAARFASGESCSRRCIPDAFKLYAGNEAIQLALRNL